MQMLSQIDIFVILSYRVAYSIQVPMIGLQFHDFWTLKILSILLLKEKCQQKLQKFKIFNNQMYTKTGTTEFMLSNIKNTIPQQLGPI